MGVIGRTKQLWREFEESAPGHRFQDRYDRRQREEQRHPFRRVFYVVLGAIAAVGSLILAPLPGPGLATVFLGLAVLAGELRPAARFLDWSEVRLRQLWQIIRDVWKGSLAGKVVVVVVAAVLAAAVLYVAYLLLFSSSLF